MGTFEEDGTSPVGEPESIESGQPYPGKLKSQPCNTFRLGWTMTRVNRGLCQIAGLVRDTWRARNDPTMPLFIPPFWFGQKMRDKIITSLIFILSLDLRPTWRVSLKLF